MSPRLSEPSPRGKRWRPSPTNTRSRLNRCDRLSATLLRSPLICLPPFVRRRDRPPGRELSLGLLRSLQNDGPSAEHIITLGWRGASDVRIRERLQDDQVLFLTQDEDFPLGETVRAM